MTSDSQLDDFENTIEAKSHAEAYPAPERAMTSSKILTLEEQTALFQRWRDRRDMDAYHQIITSNTRFAFSRARAHMKYGTPEEDLKGAAIEGLIIAAQRFQPEQNVALITFAKKIIDGKIKNAVCEYYQIPDTAYLRTIMLTLGAIRQIIKNNNPDASTDKLYDLMAAHYTQRTHHPITKDHIRFVEDRIAETKLSLNTPIGMKEDSDKAIQWLDTIQSSSKRAEDLIEENQENRIRRNLLTRVMNEVSQLQREVVEFIHMGDKPGTAKAAAAHLGISTVMAANLNNDFQAVCRKAVAEMADNPGASPIRPLLTPPAPHFQTPAHKAAFETARRVLKPVDYFLFSSVHLCAPADHIALSDIVEAINIPLAEAMERLSRSTALVLEANSALNTDQDFCKAVEDAMALACGNDDQTRVIQHAVQKTRRDHILSIAQQALSNEDFGLIQDARLGEPGTIKTLAQMADEYADTEGNIQSRINLSLKKVRLSVPVSMGFRDDALIEHYFPILSVADIDPTSPAKSYVFDLARDMMTPLKHYILCASALFSYEERLSPGDLAHRLGIQEKTLRRSYLTPIQNDLKAVLSDDVHQSIFDAVAQKVPDRIKAPPIDESRIDQTHPGIAEKMQLVRERLNQSEAYIYSSLVLYRPDLRQTSQQIADEIAKLNPVWAKSSITANNKSVKRILARVSQKMGEWLEASAPAEPYNPAKKAALDTLEMALYHIEETRQIPHEHGLGPQGQSRFWIGAAGQLRRDFNTDLNTLVRVWAKDRVADYHRQHGHAPGYSHDLIPGQKKMTWAMLDDVLCDMDGPRPI